MPGGLPLGLELCNDTDVGTSLSTTLGASVSISTNTVGSWAQVIASTAADCCWMDVTLYGPNGSAQLYAMDIGIGAAGSEKMIIQQLWQSTSTGGNTPTHWTFPCCIPAGTRIAARGQGSANDTAYVQIQLFDGAFTHMEGCGGVDSMGFNASTTTGTVVAPSATANTKGSYVQIISSTARDYIGFGFSIGSPSNGANASNINMIDVAIGASGSEKIILSNYGLSGAVSRDVTNCGLLGPFWVPIKAGTRISARAQSAVASDGGNGYVFYGIYL